MDDDSLGKWEREEGERKKKSWLAWPKLLIKRDFEEGEFAAFPKNDKGNREVGEYVNFGKKTARKNNLMMSILYRRDWRLLI